MSADREIIDADYRVTQTGEVEPARKKSRFSRGWLGPLTAILFFIGTKFKFVLTALKGVKFLGTAVTAIVSIGAYALAFGWQFGVGLVVLLFIHEMGHVLALRRYGVKATAPIFIPFLGAFIGMKQLPKDAKMEAVVGLGGPVIGSLGALGAWFLYTLYGHLIFLVLTYIGVLLNLFNLLPFLPLDGGRAVGAMSRWFWVVGGIGLLVLVVFWTSPIFLIILLLGLPEIWSRFKNRDGDGESEYYDLRLQDRIAVGATYFGLVVILGYALYELGPLVAANRPG